MSALDELRSDNASLRQRNEELVHEAANAEQALAAFARGEVDAVALDARATPILLHAAQEQLRGSRDMLEEAQAIAHVGSWSSGIGPDDVMEWSRECYRIFGVDEGTAMTVAAVLAYVHPEDLAHMRRVTRAAIDHGAPADVEHRVVRPDGQVRHVHQRGVVERDDTGHPIRMIGTLQDITDRHAIIEALRESEQRYRRIVENTTEGVWMNDDKGVTTFINGRMADMLGRAADEVIGREIFGFMKESNRTLHGDRTEPRERAVADRSDCHLLRKDGTQLWVSIQANPLFDANGHFEGVLSLVTDVSAERRADDVRAHLAAIVESSEDAIMSVSLDGMIASWNLASQTLYQYRADEIMGKSIFVLTPTPALDHEKQALERVTRGESVRQYTCHRRRKDGTLVEVAVSISPVRDPDGTVIGVSTIARDLTSRREAEAAHLRIEEQFRQAQKMEAVGRLAGGVAHDFNNLLSVILSYTEFAIEDLKPGDPLRDDMKEIHQAGLRAAELTRQLLAFSRKQVLQPRVVELDRIVEGMRTMLGRLLGEDVELSVLKGAQLGCVLADPGQIEQVVMNLAVNARDAMPGGGKLSIEIADIHFDKEYVGGLSGVPPGDYVMLAVSDTGSGMDAATRARVFEPFFTTKASGQGTGLGLSTVFGIVQQSGGYLGLYSEPGQGSTFKIYFPRTDQVPDARLSTGPVKVLRGSETILLVEDEEQVRTVACAILRRHGYHVLETSNGGEAFLISKDFTAKIHLLLTDVVMPRISGRKLAEQLVEQRPEMKVLFASGYTDDAIVHHGVVDAGVAFLQKPFTPDALLRKVREVLDTLRTQPMETHVE